MGTMETRNNGNDMNFEIGQTLNLERNPIYASSYNGAKLQESSREIAEVRKFDDGRIALKFKGSKIWFSTRQNSEWITSTRVKYRNLDWKV
jgi:hypothetical protein